MHSGKSGPPSQSPLPRLLLTWCTGSLPANRTDVPGRHRAWQSSLAEKFRVLFSTQRQAEIDPARTGLFRLRPSSCGCWSCGGWNVRESLLLIASLLTNWSWLLTSLAGLSSQYSYSTSQCHEGAAFPQLSSQHLFFLYFVWSGCVCVPQVDPVPNEDSHLS